MITKRNAPGIKITTEKEDIDIVTQLYRGHHLSPSEIEQAEKIIWTMSHELRSRRK